MQCNGIFQQLTFESGFNDLKEGSQKSAGKFLDPSCSSEKREKIMATLLLLSGFSLIMSYRKMCNIFSCNFDVSYFDARSVFIGA